MFRQQRLGEQLVDTLRLDVDDDRILAAREPDLAGAVLVGQVGELDGLLGGKPADGDV